MFTTLHTQITAPLTAAQIIDWDGATTPGAQQATLDLFHAVARQSPVAVQRALAAGARPNALRAPPMMGPQPVNHLCAPLDIALWLLTNDRNGCPLPPPNRASDATPDLCETLIAGGATTHNLPAVFFKDSGWEAHPACRALEHHFLDLLVSGRRHPIMTQEARETQPLLFRSVVVATPVRNPHAWLHRAIVRQRWDAVKAWVDQGLVLNFPGSESACELLAIGWMDEPGAEAARTMFQGFDLLRPGLLAETETAYRTEVLGAVRALAFFEDTTLDEERRAALPRWLDQLLIERPTDLGLLEQDVAGEDGPAMRRILQDLESRALRRTLAEGPGGDPGTAPTSIPDRRRL